MHGNGTRGLKFDVMLGEYFYATLTFPLYMSDGIGGGGKYMVKMETLRRFTEKKLPTLKGKPYRIEF